MPDTIPSVADTKAQPDETVLRRLLSGIAMGLVSALAALSFGAILFGSLGAVQHGVVLSLAGALIGILNSWIGGRPVVISQAQSVLVVILAVGIADLSNLLGPNVETAIKVSTATVMIVFSALVTGAVLLICGALKLGRVSRAIPYPVLGGFLAATGFLLIERGIFMGNEGLTPGLEWPDLSACVAWVFPVFLGVLLAVFSNRIGTFFALVGGWLVVIAVFWGASIAGLVDSSDGRFFLSETVQLSGATIPPVLNVMNADLSVWPAMAVTALSVAIVSFLAVLMNLAAIDQVSVQPIKIDRQLRAAGVANLTGGIFGSVVAFPSPTLDGLGKAFTPRSDGLVLCAMTATLCLFIFGGLRFVDDVPLGALAFLLAFLGTGFIVRWLWFERQKMPTEDFLIVLLIMIVTIKFGVLPAILAGFGAAILRFTLAYSRLRLLRSVTTLRDRRSSIERPESESRVLGRHGQEARLYEVRGYLFFGSISGLFSRILEDIAQRPEQMKTMILDLSKVQGLDVSAVRMISRLDHQARTKGIAVWLTGVTSSNAELLRRGGLPYETTICGQLDTALIAVETDILARFGKETEPYTPVLSILTMAQEKVGEGLLSEVPFKAGEALFEYGDPSDSLVCLVSGQLVAEIGDGNPVASFAPGALVGEVGFLTGMPRTATVRGQSNGRVLVLGRDALATLKRDHQNLANELMEALAQIVAHRLSRTTKRLVAVE